ncbi:MAG: TVP38/TMEM64 family protein, partial [Alphaproteobacteria bacterium]
MTEHDCRPAPKGRPWRRALPLALLALGLIAFFAFGLDDYVSFDKLDMHREALVEFVAANGVLAVILYLVCYATVIAFSLPGGAFMTITGGFLFGTWAGTVYTVVAATAGASVL